MGTGVLGTNMKNALDAFVAGMGDPTNWSDADRLNAKKAEANEIEDWHESGADIIKAKEIWAKDGDGLELNDDAGNNSAKVFDGGKFGIEQIRSLNGSGTTFEDDGGNVALTLADGGNLTANKASKISAERQTAQTIGNASWTKVQYATEIRDLLSEYDPTVNYRFTAIYDGDYHIDAGLLSGNYAWTTNNVWHIAVYKNGVIHRIGYRWVAQTNFTDYAHSVISYDIYLAASDYIEIYVYHTRGVNTDTYAGGIYNYFNIHRLL